jgi:hypothetical protein
MKIVISETQCLVVHVRRGASLRTTSLASLMVFDDNSAESAIGTICYTLRNDPLRNIELAFRRVAFVMQQTLDDLHPL